MTINRNALPRKLPCAKGGVSRQTCQDRACDRRNCSSDVNRTVGNAQRIGAVAEGVGKHIGIDHQNVNHGKESGHTGDAFSFYRSVAFFAFKKAI